MQLLYRLGGQNVWVHAQVAAEAKAASGKDADEAEDEEEEEDVVEAHRNNSGTLDDEDADELHAEL